MPPDNFAVGYRDAMYLVKHGDREGRLRPREDPRRTASPMKDWQGLMIGYVRRQADGELAHTMGIYRNKGRATEQIGVIKEAGY